MGFGRDGRAGRGTVLGPAEPQEIWLTPGLQGPGHFSHFHRFVWSWRGTRHCCGDRVTWQQSPSIRGSALSPCMGTQLTQTSCWNRTPAPTGEDRDSRVSSGRAGNELSPVNRQPSSSCRLSPTSSTRAAPIPPGTRIPRDKQHSRGATFVNTGNRGKQTALWFGFSLGVELKPGGEARRALEHR